MQRRSNPEWRGCMTTMLSTEAFTKFRRKRNLTDGDCGLILLWCRLGDGAAANASRRTLSVRSGGDRLAAQGSIAAAECRLLGLDSNHGPTDHESAIHVAARAPLPLPVQYDRGMPRMCSPM